MLASSLLLTSSSTTDVQMYRMQKAFGTHTGISSFIVHSLAYLLAMLHSVSVKCNTVQSLVLVLEAFMLLFCQQMWAMLDFVLKTSLHLIQRLQMCDQAIFLLR